jgi:hypothetical protein
LTFLLPSPICSNTVSFRSWIDFLPSPICINTVSSNWLFFKVDFWVLWCFSHFCIIGFVFFLRSYDLLEESYCLMVSYFLFL